MTEQEFADWLVGNGLAEPESGYGHPTGEDIARDLYAAGFAVVEARSDR